MHSRKLLGSIFGCVLAGGAAVAQLPVAGIGGMLKPGMLTLHLDSMDVEPAKGVPFCATITTEHTQVFADGNRIHTSESSAVCRDSAGRIRREASLNLLGAAAQSPVPKLITIIDPVAGYRYLLDSESKIAHRIRIAATKLADEKAALGGIPEKGDRVMIYQNIGTAGPNMVVNGDVMFKKAGKVSDEHASTEDLGEQTIDGIKATGTRITTSIPAGQMGNEQPIQVTSERWYSPELKTMIMNKHSDPWAGELKTQFTNVNTSEPEPSLFQVPNNYKVVNERAEPLVFRKQTLSAPTPTR